MAIAIKTIPVLKDTVASQFKKREQHSIAVKKSSVDFSKQLKTSSKILTKAKI